jgi:hypothetical protein
MKINAQLISVSGSSWDFFGGMYLINLGDQVLLVRYHNQTYDGDPQITCDGASVWLKGSGIEVCTESNLTESYVVEEELLSLTDPPHIVHELVKAFVESGKTELNSDDLN